MRLFLALTVSKLDLEDLRFKKLNGNLKTKNIEYRVNPSEQLNIPVAELGDVGRGGFMATYHKLRSTLESMDPFELKLSGLWAHPYQNEADMFWVGVQSSRELRYLQSKVTEILDLSEDDLIRPHIPLIYLKRKRDVSDLISPFKKFDFGSVQINEVKILEKLAGPLGTRMMASYSLKGFPIEEVTI